MKAYSRSATYANRRMSDYYSFLALIFGGLNEAFFASLARLLPVSVLKI